MLLNVLVDCIETSIGGPYKIPQDYCLQMGKKEGFKNYMYSDMLVDPTILRLLCSHFLNADVSRI